MAQQLGILAAFKGDLGFPFPAPTHNSNLLQLHLFLQYPLLTAGSARTHGADIHSDTNVSNSFLKEKSMWKSSAQPKKKGDSTH